MYVLLRPSQERRCKMLSAVRPDQTDLEDCSQAAAAMHFPLQEPDTTGTVGHVYLFKEGATIQADLFPNIALIGLKHNCITSHILQVRFVEVQSDLQEYQTIHISITSVTLSYVSVKSFFPATQMQSCISVFLQAERQSQFSYTYINLLSRLQEEADVFPF